MADLVYRESSVKTLHVDRQHKKWLTASNSAPHYKMANFHKKWLTFNIEWLNLFLFLVENYM